MFICNEYIDRHTCTSTETKTHTHSHGHTYCMHARVVAYSQMRFVFVVRSVSMLFSFLFHCNKANNCALLCYCEPGRMNDRHLQVHTMNGSIPIGIALRLRNNKQQKFLKPYFADCSPPQQIIGSVCSQTITLVCCFTIVDSSIHHRASEEQKMWQRNYFYICPLVST